MVNHTRNEHHYTVFIIKLYFLYFSVSRECSKVHKNEAGEQIYAYGDGNLHEWQPRYHSNNQKKQNMSILTISDLAYIMWHALYKMLSSAPGVILSIPDGGFSRNSIMCTKFEYLRFYFKTNYCVIMVSLLIVT